MLGYVAPFTYVNQHYVTIKKIEQWLYRGYSAYQIALMWNGGTATEKHGINKYGEAYDTAKYAQTVITYLNE